jgi:hypothetical protein
MSKHTPTLVWLVLCLVFVLLSWNCATGGTTVGWTDGGAPIVRVPTKITSYPLLDSFGEQHKYRENFDSFIFPQDNKKLTLYCAFHWEWENIKAVYTKDENDHWGYFYIVSKNKKSWK